MCSITAAAGTTASSVPASRRCAFSRYLISFLSLSLVGFCTSEALVPSSTSFLPRSLWMRGGSNGKSKTNVNNNASLKCVLQVPRSGSAKYGMDDDSNEGMSNNLKNPNKNGRFAASAIGRVTKINGGSTTTAVNGSSKTSAAKRNGKSSAYLDYPIPAEYIAETNLPTDVGQYRLRAYRTEKGSNEFTGTEPCVIYCADKSPFGTDGKFRREVPVRIHDQCLTSEVFRSQRCDCKDQLKMALEYIGENGGAIIYLQQEGRGIGLANKVAAYALQDIGMDTVDANLHLGFEEDCRQYGVVPAILADMRIGSIRLMTNNPRKVERLSDLGVKVVDTIPMVVPETNPHNYRYLEAKKDRMNHTNLSPLFLRNGNMVPKRPIISKDFATEGEEMAANAVHVSLSTMGETSVVDRQSGLDLDDETQEGVLATQDGYCFGKQSVEDAIEAVRQGKMVVVVDDMNRENEGDLIMAADACTPEDMAKIVRYSSGVICIAMNGDRMDELNLPSMVANNEDPKNTAFSITVDATKEHGITTGISATDRARTVNLLANPASKSVDFHRPGHIFPLRAREGGVLARDGHTEAAVDLSVLAGRAPAGILCEIVSEENPVEMARLPELKRFCKRHGFVLTSIVDIAQYRREMNLLDLDQ